MPPNNTRKKTSSAGSRWKSQRSRFARLSVQAAAVRAGHHIAGACERLLEAALEKARKALDDNADIATLRSVKEELEQAYGQACQCKPEAQGPTVENPPATKKAGMM
jgi:hypothetical protein